MPDEPVEDLTPEQIEYLDRLIRESDPDDGLTAPEIEDEIVRRHLKGETSPEEGRKMQRALADASLLGEEILYTERLRDPEVQARFDATPVRDAAPERMAVAVPRRRRWFSGPALAWGALAAAAALAFVVVYGQFSVRRSAWSPRAPLGADQFERDPLRGTGEGLPEPANASQAAVRAFLEAVVWNGADFAFVPTGGAPVAPGRAVTVHVKGAPDYTAAVPEGALDLEVWFLPLPSLQPYATALPPDAASLSLAWPAAGDARAAVTIAYQLNGRYSATPAGEIVHR